MKPRILLIGKSGSIVQWLEDARDGLEDAGASPEIFALNGNTPLAAMRVRLAKLRWPATLERHPGGRLGRRQIRGTGARLGLPPGPRVLH